ncbi:helix-turn-helix domain-containing protein [Acinetobacter baumannii]
MISLSPPTICNSAREFGISRETLYQYLRTDQ